MQASGDKPSMEKRGINELVEDIRPVNARR